MTENSGNSETSKPVSQTSFPARRLSNKIGGYYREGAAEGMQRISIIQHLIRALSMRSKNNNPRLH